MIEQNKILFESLSRVDDMRQRTKAFIWANLLETSVAFKALPPEVIPLDEMTRNVHGEFVKVLDVEPGSEKPVIHGDPLLNGFKGMRVEIPLVRFQSPNIHTSIDISKMEIPFTKMLEDQICRPMADTLDYAFFNLCKTAAEQSGNTQTVKRSLSGKDILIHGFNSIDRNRLSSFMTICGKDFYNKIYEEEMAGEAPKPFEEMIRVGDVEYPAKMSKQFVVSLNKDIFKDNLYFFAAPRYLGKSYIMDTMEFNIDMKFSKMAFDFHLEQALAILNTAAVGVVTLED